MRSQKMITLFFLLLFLLGTCGCNSSIAEVSSEIQATEATEFSVEKEIGFRQFADVVIDNDSDLASCLTTEYSLAELEAWFPKYNRQETMALHPELLASQRPTFEEVNERFPVECLRSNPLAGMEFYSVYRVKEGGLYYVFWGNFPLPYARDDYTPPEVVTGADVFFSVYMRECPKLEAFSSITPGVSTAEDVAAIDPSLELRFIRAAGPYSCSLLDDGKVLVVYYRQRKAEETWTSRQDMIVSEMALKEPLDTAFNIAGILEKDLP